jgi:hypothetical protein
VDDDEENTMMIQIDGTDLGRYNPEGGVRISLSANRKVCAKYGSVFEGALLRGRKLKAIKERTKSEFDVRDTWTLAGTLRKSPSGPSPR